MRKGNWIQTYTGKPFWPLDPRPEDIRIEDIARSLSMRCRYGGHVKRFYSVAEHSVIVSRHVPAEFALWGLLHDASEAYSADLPRPLKKCLPDWKPLEAKIMAAVAERFGLVGEEPAEVKTIDLRICGDEQKQILAPSALEWDEQFTPLGVELQCLHPDFAETLFLDRYREIMGQPRIFTGKVEFKV